MHDSSASFLSCAGKFLVGRLFRHSNQNRCIGNSKADKCDDLPGFCRTLIDGKPRGGLVAGPCVRVHCVTPCAIHIQGSCIFRIIKSFRTTRSGRCDFPEIHSAIHARQRVMNSHTIIISHYRCAVIAGRCLISRLERRLPDEY